MPIRIIEEPIENLPAYSEIPIAYCVEARFRIEPGQGGPALIEEPVTLYLKDYDALPGNKPTDWAELWNLTNWGILAAYDGEQRVGGAIIAWKTPGLDMLRGRDDLAVLWDLRVHPDYRGRSVGSRLFGHAVQWARARGCRALEVETQNTNVPACRFYSRQGCQLSKVDSQAYPELPNEVQLIWTHDLNL